MKVKLLIVDDEAEICDMLSRHFRYQGYDVETAENGIEALEILDQASYQVVISDIAMPKMTGVQLLEAIRQQHPMIHCIMMTGFVTLENALACMQQGADTCIFKPFESLVELQSAVEDAVRALKRWQEKLKMLQAMNPTLKGGRHG